MNDLIEGSPVEKWNRWPLPASILQQLTLQPESQHAAPAIPTSKNLSGQRIPDPVESRTIGHSRCNSHELLVMFCQG